MKKQVDDSKCKICPDCGEQMTSYTVPKEGIIFRIPFTEIEVIWRKWNCKNWYCSLCTYDRQSRLFREAYIAGLQDGYNRGYNDAII
jgi:hypothetical protein